MIQIFDTDGTYIPDSTITAGNTYDFIYSTTNISCRDISRVAERNKRKKMVMDYLLSRQNIKGISYEGYFMSCKLDHALYNILNLSEDIKQEYADLFHEQFINKERLFIDFLKSDVVNGVPENYQKSWDYIREGTHSLERHTNLNIYFILHPVPPLI